MQEIERRTFVGEVRAKDGDGMAFTGYAARFNEETYIGPPKQGFYERIAPGAFANAIKNCDVRSLFNHNPDHLLGRKSAGTLSLTEDGDGLRADNALPDTSLGRDISALVARGDLTGMSFSFTVTGEEWSSKPGGHAQLRTITEIGELIDVGPVTFPAYDTTSASVRSVVRKAATDKPQKEGRTERRQQQTEKRGLVAMVCASDAAVDAAAIALDGGNLAQAMALLDAAFVALLDADWYLWSTDSELLAALGCGDVDDALATAWDAIAAAINVGDNATDASGLDLSAALAATDQLLAALRLPDADAPATEDKEGDVEPNDDTERSTRDQSEMEAQWLETAGVLATQ